MRGRRLVFVRHRRGPSAVTRVTRSRLSSGAVPSRYLHPLVCTKCGAALPAEEGQQILVCPYCGQSHAFVPPPGPPPLEPGRGQPPWPASSTAALTYALIGLGVVLVAGMAITAALAGRATTTTTATNETSTTKGPGDPNAVYTKGQAVDIYWVSRWYQGSIVEVDGTRYKAHYLGYASTADEWVRANRLRPLQIEDTSTEATPDAAASSARSSPVTATDGGDPKATYESGEAVKVLWSSSWYPGTIKKAEGSRYLIGYDGYSSSWDEWVTARRLRKRGAP